jgi:lipopolysaccharide biosynthesis glycosyltransferase
MIRIFCGQDPREQVGLAVWCSSIWRRSSKPAQITPISGPTDGSNAFTLSRFKVPELCDYRGWAIWADGSDMLCLADIAELWAMQDQTKAVHVVKHNYKTRHPVKYLGQKNEDYERKNWSSLMLINCAHYGWRHLEKYEPSELHRLHFLADKEIGEIPGEWNYLIGEDNKVFQPKIAHFTVGLPVWGQYADWELADEWRKEREAMLSFQEWK